MLGTEPDIEASFVETGQVQLIFNPVLNHGDRSVQAHLAVECAAEQQDFWSFRRYLFENQNALWGGDIRQALKNLALEAGLDSESFNLCLDEQRYLARIQAQDEIRKNQGIFSQPVLDINGELLVGSQPTDVVAPIIQKHLEP